MRRRSFLMLGPAAMAGLAAVKLPNGANARLQDDGTPTAEGTPEAEESSSVEVVTLVSWYQQDESGDFLSIGPLASNQFSVASPGSEGEGLSGRADFDDPDNNDLPRITLGDHVFDAYPMVEDDPETVFRWSYLDDEGGRPATLVILVNCTSSPTYQDYSGSATCISRADNAGGILVIALNPPA
jgi:hypothetical protein